MSELLLELAHMREALNGEEIHDLYLPLRRVIKSLEPDQIAYAALYPLLRYCPTFLAYELDQEWVLEFFYICIHALENRGSLPRDTPFDSRLFFDPLAIPFHRTYVSLLADFRALLQTDSLSKPDLFTQGFLIAWKGMDVWEEELWTQLNRNEWQTILYQYLHYEHSKPRFWGGRHLLPVERVTEHWLGLVNWIEQLVTVEERQPILMPKAAVFFSPDQVAALRIYKREVEQADLSLIVELEQFPSRYHIRYAAPFDALTSRLFIQFLGLHAAVSFVLRLIESSLIWFEAVNPFVTSLRDQIAALQHAINTLQPVDLPTELEMDTLSADDGSSHLVAAIGFVARAISMYEKPDHAMSLTLLALHKWIHATLKQSWLYKYGAPLTWDARMSRNGTWLETEFYDRVIADMDKLVEAKRQSMR